MRRDIEATATGLGVRVDQDDTLLVGSSRVRGLAKVTCGRALAVVYSNDDRSRGLEVLGHVDVHAHLGRTGVEAIDLLQLALPDRCEGSSREKTPHVHDGDYIDESVGRGE